MGRKPWTFVTNHGAVLALLGSAPDITGRRIAASLDITERTVLRILSDLEQSGYIQRRKQGRRNLYSVNLELPLRRPDQRDVLVSDLIKVLDF